MKRKIKLVFLAVFGGTVLFSSCTDDDPVVIDVKQITLNESNIQLGIGEVHALTLATSPEGATAANVVWSSNDESIAKVQYNESGLVAGVMGISEGGTTLTAKPNGAGSEQSVTVNVIKKVESIALEETVSTDPSTTTYSVVFTPADATIQEIEWSSSDPSVATVVDGLITAAAPGATVITATTVEGGLTAVVEINVSGNPPILGLQYCSITGTGGYNAGTVTTTGASSNLNYSGAQPADNYEYYTAEKIITALEAQFSLSLTQDNNWSRSIVWIDWNADKDFDDDGEMVLELGLPAQLNDGPFDGLILVPIDATIGSTKMRIQTLDAWVDPGLCGEVPNQSTKDFDLEIQGVSYCSISGTGAYNADTVTTIGADADINYTGPQPSNNYEFYTAESLKVNSGGNFTLSITMANNWSKTKVWIDWNADGDFEDDGELAVSFGLDAQLNDGPFSEQVEVSSGAIVGPTRMRIQTLDAWSDPGLCGEVANSSTKDFNIEIL